MIGWSGWKSMVQSAAQTIANLVGQDIVAKSISLTQTATNIAVQLVDGARLKLGTGTTDYMESNGATRITAAGIFHAADSLEVPTDAAIYLNGTTRSFGFKYDGTQLRALSTTNLGPVADAGTNLGAAALRWSTLYLAGSLALTSSDSSGSPGAATINLPNGRSAIAAGASSAVITNSLVTAASHVFISTRTRDATGLLPLVTTIGAGSFTVSTSANCTAALVFDWLVTA